jgi:hypothetical protein
MSGGPLAELRASVKSLDSVAEKLKTAESSRRAKLLQSFQARLAKVEQIWNVVLKSNQ